MRLVLSLTSIVLEGMAEERTWISVQVIRTTRALQYNASGKAQVLHSDRATVTRRAGKNSGRNMSAPHCSSAPHLISLEKDQRTGGAGKQRTGPMWSLNDVVG